MKRNYKFKRTEKSTVTIDGVVYNLGNLYTKIKGYCTSTKKYKIEFKCLLTGKTFTDSNLLSKHLVETLISKKKIVL